VRAQGIEPRPVERIDRGCHIGLPFAQDRDQPATTAGGTNGASP
jgi:hypothetical protein